MPPINLHQPANSICLAIKQAVCLAYGITIEQLESKDRSKPLPDARYIAMKLMREFTPYLSYKKIGEQFSNRDHTTVTHGLNQFDNLFSTDEYFRNKYEHVKRYLNTNKTEDNEHTETK